MTTIVIRFNVKMHKSFFQKIIMVFVKFQFSSFLFLNLSWFSEGKSLFDLGRNGGQTSAKPG